ncbi:iron uptake porin [Synechococcus sp. MIT S9452]|uniref:iron uptake porin n=1 Tax=Synechococcus sp. MIT S9452 TaxID=3082546 RepID=UPI0039A51DA5
MKDAVVTNNSFSIPDATVGVIEVASALQGVKGGLDAGSYLRARNFVNTDKYGGTQKLRVQSSSSSTSNFKAYSIQMDKADYGALVNLANKARRVKSYDYYNFTNAFRGNGATANTTAGLIQQTKAAGVPDPVKVSDIARGYLATTNLPTVTAAGFTEGSALLTGIGAGGFVVTPGGFAQNNSVYSNVADYLIAEYGSLSEQQRKTSYVKKAAQAFVRSLAAYPANKNGVADRNAFTFGHDAQLNFNTSFTGKDKLNFRLRANTIYSFAKRVGAPFADLAFDGSLPENWKGKKEIFLDKLYYKFPVGSWGKASVGTRAPQSSFTTRGSMYTKDALLEFFNTAGGVYPSVTGTGFGVQVSKIGGKKLKVLNGSVAGSIGYIANEGDSANPASYNYLQEGFFGRDTRFRLPVQLAWKSKGKKWLFTANYAYERGMNSMGKVGTELAKNPFGYSNLIESNQYGFTLAYKWSKQFQITGSWGGNSMSSRYDSSVLGIDMTGAGDTATTNSWMIALNFKDVFIEGNKAGFAIGGVPTVTSSDSGWGTDSSQPIALETWYQFQVSDGISVTPGVFWVSGQTGQKTGKYGQVSVDGSNGDVWGGIVKTEFKF